MKKIRLSACLMVFALLHLSTVAVAHPGHADVAAVHGEGVGVWLLHQLYNKDVVMTFVVLAAIAALTGGRWFRSSGTPRRRRVRG